MLIKNCRSGNQQPDFLFEKCFDINGQIYKTLQYFTFAEYFTCVDDIRSEYLVSTSSKNCLKSLCCNGATLMEFTISVTVQVHVAYNTTL